MNMQNLINDTKDLTILYVEDNKETRETTLLVLENLFNNIIVGVDGVDGLEKFKSNSNIEIIISDINMPRMDGLSMSKEILAINPYMPILIFSAHNEASFFVDAIEIGVEGYLLKPLNMKQFLQQMIKCVEKIKLRKENLEYKNSLEEKVKIQLEQIVQKDNLLIQNSKMAAMGEMIDIIAHQWKQPLNNIVMRADFMSELVKDGDEITNQELIQCGVNVSKQVKHLVTTIDEFRKFFRPTLEIETIQLSSLLSSVKLLLKDTLIDNNINVIVEVNDINFRTNENEFKHIFINLIHNAKDAFVQNNIQNRKILIEAKEYENNIIVTVEDNAGGIKDDIIKDIFKQNFTTKQAFDGTGIGLYLCQIIATKYNSTISAKSYDDKTIFEIDIKKLNN